MNKATNTIQSTPLSQEQLVAAMRIECATMDPFTAAASENHIRDFMRRHPEYAKRLVNTACLATGGVDLALALSDCLTQLNGFKFDNKPPPGFEAARQKACTALARFEKML